MRVVTTLPSATELVAALGIDPVGVSHECDYPPGVAERPSVTSSRIDADGSSGEIDQQVLEAGEGASDASDLGTASSAERSSADSHAAEPRDDGETASGEDTEGGVYDVDAETIEQLEPDVVVTQGVCDVCAVDEVLVEGAIDGIDANPEIVTIDSHTIAEVFDDLERLGRALDRADRAETVRTELEDRLEAVRERTPDAPEARPRVAVLDWTNPVMVAAHWVPELVEAAGGRYELASAGEDARPREWDELRRYDPEILVVAPCGFDLAQTAANLADLTDRDGWADITAVRTGRAWAMDGDHYLNRPGPRLVDAAETLARILHPDRFDDSDDTAAGEGARPADDIAVPIADIDARIRS